MKRTILSLFLCLFVSSSFGANFGSDEQALRRLNREQALAMYMGDPAWFRIHVSDDYVLVTENGVEKTKAELVRELEKLEKSVVMSPYEPTDVTIRAHGGTAIVTGRILQKYTEGGERVIADLRFSDIWIKTDNGWFGVYSQLTPVSIKREKVK